MLKSKTPKLMLLVLAMLFLLTGCGKHMDKTTTFYSLITDPANNYVRLEADGDYFYSFHLSGKYELDGNVVKMSDSSGAEFESYLYGEYLFWSVGYENNEKIPDGDRFDAVVYDGIRSTMTFSSDGIVKQDIVDGMYDFHLAGTYVREDNIVTCTYRSSNGNEAVNVYGIRDGILYNTFSSNESRFNAEQIADKEAIDNNGSEDNISVVAVVIIVVLLSLMLVLLFYVIIKSKSDKNAAEKGSSDK